MSKNLQIVVAVLVALVFGVVGYDTFRESVTVSYFGSPLDWCRTAICPKCQSFAENTTDYYSYRCESCLHQFKARRGSDGKQQPLK